MRNQMIKSENTLRQFGLGRGPQGLSQDQCLAMAHQTMQMNFGQVPNLEYVNIHIELPMLDTDIASAFGAEIPLSTFPKSTPGVQATVSNMAINGLTQVDLVVVGYGVHIRTPAQRGTILCNVFSPAPAVNAVPVSPDAFSTAVFGEGNGGDVKSGSLGLPGSPGTPTTTITPGLLEVGGPSANAAWNLCMGYQFNWTVCQRYALVQELLKDVAYLSPSDLGQSGVSAEAAQRFVRLANNRYTTLGLGGLIVPINAQRIGSIDTTAVGGVTGVNHGVFHPTRAYDEVPVTWDDNGGQTSGTMFRKFQKPLFIEKGETIDMSLIEQDSYYGRQFRNYLSISDGLGGTNAIVPFAAGAGGTTVSTANAFVELTLDATAVADALQVNTDRALLKQGALNISIYLKAYEICSNWAGYMPICCQQGLLCNPASA